MKMSFQKKPSHWTLSAAFFFPLMFSLSITKHHVLASSFFLINFVFFFFLENSFGLISCAIFILF